MIESIRSFLSPKYREERRLTNEAEGIVYRLSILNRDTLEEEARLLKERGLNVEVIQEPRLHLVVRPLNSSVDPIEGYRVYLNLESGMTSVKQIRRGSAEDFDYGDISELEASIKEDLRHLRNTQKKK